MKEFKDQDIKASGPFGPEALPEQEQKINHLRLMDGFAVCGSLGTPAQPFDAGSNHYVTDNQDAVNCPLCLELMADTMAEPKNS